MMHHPHPSIKWYLDFQGLPYAWLVVIQNDHHFIKLIHIKIQSIRQSVLTVYQYKYSVHMLTLDHHSEIGQNSILIIEMK